MKTPKDCPPHIHGTPSGYGYYGCRCVECRENNRARAAKMRADRATRLEDAPHGTPGAYVNWGCRCTGCKAAYSVYQKKKTTR